MLAEATRDLFQPDGRPLSVAKRGKWRERGDYYGGEVSGVDGGDGGDGRGMVEMMVRNGVYKERKARSDEGRMAGEIVETGRLTKGAQTAGWLEGSGS